MKKSHHHTVILLSLAASMAVSGLVGAGTELVFQDNFNTANNLDPNQNLATRQSGTLAPREYTQLRGASGISISNNQILVGSDTHLHVLGNNTDFTNLLRNPAYTRFTVSFDSRLTATGGWTSPYISTTGTGGEDRGGFGLLLFPNGSMTAYSASGNPSLSAAQVGAILGFWDIMAPNTYTWVATKTSATTGSYRILINGIPVFIDLPYTFNATTTQRWNVRNPAGGGALYDNLNIEVFTPHPLSTTPEDGAIVLGGDVALSWTNLPANIGSDVWVDVWFGTDPDNLSRILGGGLNATTVTVNLTESGTYYWRVDSYLDGNPDGTPEQSPMTSFIVIDSDGDGLPDWWEIQYFGGPTAADASADPDDDGLTNLQEFFIGTHPLNPDTDGDGLPDGVETNTGIWVSASNTGTHPLKADTDGDGLIDGVETNTGVWVSATNTGTNPNNPDTDGDGLKDGVETNTGIYLSRSNTGSNPLLKDTDGDGVGDYYEAVAAMTNPSDPSDRPSVPYPLPAPDGSHGAPDKPVKVYIMSGQSNMVGIGYLTGTAPGTFESMTRRENKFPHFISGGAYSKRNDVIYKGFIGGTAAGALTTGMGSASTRVGVEVGFGHVMGWYHDEPVLLLKSSEGNRSLGWDFLPPGSPRWTSGTTTYAGYGDPQQSWPTGEEPAPGVWYAGKQYDDCFNAVKTVLNNGVLQGMPTVDGQSLNGRNYEIAGFVWWQGHADQGNGIFSSRYEINLVRLINELRNEFNAPGAPFVLGTIAFGGPPLDTKTGTFKNVYNAQMAVSDPAKHSQFAGNVKTVDALPYWRPPSESPGTQDFHYFNNAETYTLVGDALARAMIDLLVDETPPFPNPMTFAIAPSGAGIGSIGMVATTATDVSNPVEYFFGNKTLEIDSGWISDTTWISTGLTDGASYNFRVKARDAEGNETEWSAEFAATAGPDITPPSPDPMTFASPPITVSQSAITMTASPANDFNEVEYYFECILGGGPDSGWQTATTFTATSLTPGTEYTYVVRAKDSLGNTTADSDPASATTTPPDTTPPIVVTLSPTDNAINVSVGSDLVITFDEAITAGSGSVIIANLIESTDTVIAINDPQIVIAGSTLTINPSANLKFGTSYAIRIDATAVRDLAGNAFLGIIDDTTWNFSTTTTSLLLFRDDFNAATGTSLTDPASRATGTLASTVKYAWTNTTNIVVDGTLNWDANNTRNGLHQFAASNGTQNFRTTHNWAPQVAGKIWEVEFDQRVGWNHPLTFGLSDNSQNGNWAAWNDANYDFATGSYGTSLHYDTDNDDGGIGTTNDHRIINVFPSLVAANPPTNEIHHFLIRFDEPAGKASVMVNGILRVTVNTLDFENPGRYLSWGEPNQFAGALDNLTVRVINTLPVWENEPIAGADAQVNAAYLATLVNDVTGIDPGGSLVFAKVSGPDWLLVDADGTLTGTPGGGDLGLNTSTVSVSDGISTPAQATLYIKVIDSGGGSTFAGYISNPAFGLDPSEQGFSDDPDGDGLANGLEAWFGTHPGEFSAGLANVTRDGNTIIFTHPRNENSPTDISGNYEWSPNLVDWYPGDGLAGPPGGPTVTITSETTAVTTTVTATSSGALGKIFLRAGVQRE